MYRFRLLVSIVAWISLASAVFQSATFSQDDEDSPFRPGLAATYSTGEVANRADARRIDEVVAFDWQDGSPDPRLPAGPFDAQWRGKLWAKSVGQHRLLCYVQGEVEIKLLGRTVITGKAAEPTWLTSEAIELEFGRHELEINYRRPGDAGQLALFWSGTDFRLEPIPERALLHDREGSPTGDFERGRQLAAALRCAACHADSAVSVIPAPALDRLTGNISGSWLVSWLSTHAAGHTQQSQRRMPDLGITPDEATAIAAWLLREPAVKVKPQEPPRTAGESKGKKSAKKKGEPEKPKPSADEGERILLTRGCLACHQMGKLGESGLYGGGDLTRLFEKRPEDFFLRWLDNPAAINRSHRMPVFAFTPDEVKSLSLWAKEQSDKAGSLEGAKQNKNRELIAKGEILVGQFGCANCHVTASDRNELAAAKHGALTAKSAWPRSCCGDADRAKMRPGYRLADADRAALMTYYSQPRPGEAKQSLQAVGHDLLVQLNCLACHQREGVKVVGTLRVPSPSNDGTPTHFVDTPVPATLQDKLAAVAEKHDDLAPLVPAMTPPALNSVGDKLLDAALADAISREGPPHRPYLLVQMPTFKLAKDQLDSLVAYFTATDRIPRGSGVSLAGENAAGKMPTPQLLAAGPRLVTTDGLACTSCHQVGSVPPAKAPINARGPNLSLASKRIRREWFERFCADPARIVPRMEMPSVKVPIRGVLNEKIDDQLAAVWHILNTPGFEPPEPNPVRVLRLSGVPERNEKPIVIHDVVKDGDKTYLYPLVIGLPNRHNILFDLETNRLAAWWLGDTARQRTKGKSWYWEMGGKSIVDFGFDQSELTLLVEGKELFPTTSSQFAANINRYDIDDGAGVFTLGRLSFPLPEHDPNRKQIEVVWQDSIETFPENSSKYANLFVRGLAIFGRGPLGQVRLRLVGPRVARDCTWDDSLKTLTLPNHATIQLKNSSNTAWDPDGFISVQAVRPNQTKDGAQDRWEAGFQLWYSQSLPIDQYLGDPSPVLINGQPDLEVAPGFVAKRLPLPAEIMPSGLSWDKKERLYFTTLKGQVFEVDDSNEKPESTLRLIVDGLATPYGIQVEGDREQRLFIGCKDGMIAVARSEEDRKTLVSRVAPFWGHTEDYHDWAVGPVPGALADYYMALPCQQDQRTDAAAKYRGKVVRIFPHLPTPEDPRWFDIEIISSGHRFPMGMARNREGELFVTDNQGNYNPFNELNHVRKGAHFGFINALEKEQGYRPPKLDEPAIDIPHPWTRSVNGICFLETPSDLSAGTKPGPDAPGASLLPAKSIYGPFEGHLVGCEYDTKRLIRMSLQKIGDTYQGCAYPLSIATEDVEKGLLGPIVCAVKPTTGELYVGEIRDSGWAAGNNIGQIVKIKIEPEKLPCGIAEVRATSTGFTIDFIQPVDRAKAADAASYVISSYRRESTPAYGGPDLDRRGEAIKAIAIDEAGKRVTLTLSELRPGHLYEFKLKNVAPQGGVFHPDEAHYTLRMIPQ